LNVNISQSIVPNCLRCDEIVNNHIIANANLLLTVHVKDFIFLKSVL